MARRGVTNETPALASASAPAVANAVALDDTTTINA
jgi:hypothetical protein